MAKKFITLVLLQALVLLFMAGSNSLIESSGDEVRLKTAPVDPRDVLYGDYVTLNYDISDIDIHFFTDGEKPKRGDTVYVLLKREGDYDQLVSAHLNKPSPSNGEKVMKGRVEYVVQNWVSNQRQESRIESVRVLYGIERYYVSEGTGKELENKRGQFDVIVKVTSWGQTLSSISFIANGVITQWDAQERVYDYFNQKSLHVEVVRSDLTNQYKEQDRAVWIVEVRMIRDKTGEVVGETITVVVDAKTGEILE